MNLDDEVAISQQQCLIIYQQLFRYQLSAHSIADIKTTTYENFIVGFEKF